MSETPADLPISPDLLEILRDPVAVQEPEKYGPDPGRLELVHNSWLVSKDTGYKYPIKDGIPVMLIEEGARWKDTPVDELPVPPETADPAPAPAGMPANLTGGGQSEGTDVRIFAIGALLALFVIVGLWQYLSRRSSDGDASEENS